MSDSTRNRALAAESDLHHLSGNELEQVSGGMKWDRNHVSKNVIDARGGQGSFLNIHWTYDINGNVSSVEVR